MKGDTWKTLVGLVGGAPDQWRPVPVDEVVVVLVEGVAHLGQDGPHGAVPVEAVPEADREEAGAEHVGERQQRNRPPARSTPAEASSASIQGRSGEPSRGPWSASRRPMRSGSVVGEQAQGRSRRSTTQPGPRTGSRRRTGSRCAPDGCAGASPHRCRGRFGRPPIRVRQDRPPRLQAGLHLRRAVLAPAPAMAPARSRFLPRRTDAECPTRLTAERRPSSWKPYRCQAPQYQVPRGPGSRGAGAGRLWTLA